MRLEEEIFGNLACAEVIPHPKGYCTIKSWFVCKIGNKKPYRIHFETCSNEEAYEVLNIAFSNIKQEAHDFAEFNFN